MYNYKKLIDRIIEKYGSQKKFAKIMGLSDCELSLKLNNRRAITKTQILEMMKLLDIPKEEVYEYFLEKL